jgi:hypothetical protein
MARCLPLLSSNNVARPRFSQAKENLMAKYGETAKKEVKKALHKTKRGQQHSGKGKKKVKSKKQAIAIGLSKARKKGGKVPRKKKSAKKKKG